MKKSYYGLPIIELLIDMNPERSRSEMKRLVEQGGVTIYWTHPQSKTCRFVPEEDVEILKDWKKKLTEYPELVKIGKRLIREVVFVPNWTYVHSTTMPK